MIAANSDKAATGQDQWRTDDLVPCSPGLLKRSTLPRMLGASGWQRQPSSDAPVFVGWGRKPSGQRAVERAGNMPGALLLLEDGFLRSVELGFREEPCSVVVDDLGIYYDASAPSRLEALARNTLDSDQMARGQALIGLWRQQRVSKYNNGPEAIRAEPLDGAVLVVDQTAGDASIEYGMADATSFSRMLEAAADENPHSPILLKVHPDVIAGKRKGHFSALGPALSARVNLIASPAHPPALLESISACYVVTSQLGFEALMWNKPVRCFGMPFYAGWSLTADELAAPARRRKRPLENLVHAALVDYARYLHPETGQACTAESLIRWMGLQRRMRTRFGEDKLRLLGFSRWKKPIARVFFQGVDMRFARSSKTAHDARSDVGWGRKVASVDLHVEDGFLRSVGLGADLIRPVSWVMDRRGIYFDATAPSDLETLLQEARIDDQLLDRARNLREKIVAAGLTKYNVGGASWARDNKDQHVVLVPGQVESDASIRFGAFDIRSNLQLLEQVRRARPGSKIIYKPHPDVAAGLRKGAAEQTSLERYCDEIVRDVPMNVLLDQVDELHVMTSLAGFEALLRGVDVVTWGQPFYAGWGLTRDKLSCPRRTRKRSLDELVAASLILYPVYISWKTGRYTSAEQALQELIEWRERGPDQMPQWRQAQRHVLRLFTR